MGEDRPAAHSRRTFLGSAGAGALGALAGCAGALGLDSRSVALLSAGSLARTFEDHVGPAFEAETGRAVHGEYYGSNAVVRMVLDGTAHPDVVVSADASLLFDRLYGRVTDWDVAFASNSLGLAYDGSTAIGRRLDAGEPWYEAVEDADGGDVAIADPDLDPLGYRAIQGFELAERHHGLEGFRDRMERRVYTEPEEPQLLAGLETGSRAAAVLYRNMAADRGLPFLGFPDAYDFSNPDLADHYATVSYTTDDGYTATGRPIVYAATVTDDADSPVGGRDLVQFLLDSPDLLAEAGLGVGDRLPRGRGSVPPEVDP